MNKNIRSYLRGELMKMIGAKLRPFTLVEIAEEIERRNALALLAIHDPRKYPELSPFFH
jgi:hypothetical protein